MQDILHQKAPMIYSENTGNGDRRPKPLKVQLDEFNRDVDRIWREIKDQFPSESPPQGEHDAKAEPEPEPEQESEQESEQEEPEDEKEFFLREVRRLRHYCKDSEQAGQMLDTIGMRPVSDGRRAFKVGLSARAMLFAMTLHWSPETRTSASVETYDPSAISNGDTREGRHKLLSYVRKLADARIPILIVGEKGTGKSTLATQLAEDMQLPFSYMSLNGATTPSWFFGNWTPDPVCPYKTRPLKELYKHGGVFCIDEIDAGEPNMLLVLNNLISSDTLECPMTGESIEKHPDFVLVATANTHGLGANRQYTGRERMDAATLDRFRMGRVMLDLDENLERHILFAED